jgi:hypothetical protein
MKLLFFVLLFISHSSFAMLVKDGKVIFEKISDYSFCINKDYTGEWCHQALLDWVDSHPDDAFAAGKLTRQHTIHWSALPYFEKSMTTKNFDCKDEDLKLATLSGLNLPLKGNEKIVSTAKEIGLKKCSNEIKASIIAEAALDSQLFINTCSTLELSGLKKTKCKSLQSSKK